MKNKKGLQDMLDTLLSLKDSLEEYAFRSIGEVALRTEHQKFFLAEKFNELEHGKSKFLLLRNVALIEEQNLYAFFGRFFDDEDMDEAFKELEESHACKMKALKKFLKEIKED